MMNANRPSASFQASFDWASNISTIRTTGNTAKINSVNWCRKAASASVGQSKCDSASPLWRHVCRNSSTGSSRPAVICKAVPSDSANSPRKVAPPISERPTNHIKAGHTAVIKSVAPNDFKARPSARPESSSVPSPDRIRAFESHFAAAAGSKHSNRISQPPLHPEPRGEDQNRQQHRRGFSRASVTSDDNAARQFDGLSSHNAASQALPRSEIDSGWELRIHSTRSSMKFR